MSYICLTLLLPVSTLIFLLARVQSIHAIGGLASDFVERLAIASFQLPVVRVSIHHRGHE